MVPCHSDDLARSPIPWGAEMDVDCFHLMTTVGCVFCRSNERNITVVKDPRHNSSHKSRFPET